MRIVRYISSLKIGTCCVFILILQFLQKSKKGPPKSNAQRQREYRARKRAARNAGKQDAESAVRMRSLSVKRKVKATMVVDLYRHSMDSILNFQRIYVIFTDHVRSTKEVKVFTDVHHSVQGVWSKVCRGRHVQAGPSPSRWNRDGHHGRIVY